LDGGVGEHRGLRKSCKGKGTKSFFLISSPDFIFASREKSVSEITFNWPFTKRLPEASEQQQQQALFA